MLTPDIEKMQIESIEIRNYRVFKHAVLSGIKRLAVLVGENGAGKSTLFDVFTFLKDALSQNVAKAVSKRGGFRELSTRESEGPIGLTIKFRETGGRLATYELEITQKDGIAIVEREILKFRRGKNGKPWHFVDFSNGHGKP
jgi:predicted ATPase